MDDDDDDDHCGYSQKLIDCYQISVSLSLSRFVGRPVSSHYYSTRRQ